MVVKRVFKGDQNVSKMSMLSAKIENFSEIAAERAASKSDEKAAEIEQEVILIGEQWYCQKFVNKIIQ